MNPRLFNSKTAGSVLSIVIVILAVFVLLNFLVYSVAPKLDVGVDSQWVYNVYIGGSQGLATYWYEEKVLVDSIVYCEKLLCYKLVRNNPTHLQTDYVTGDRFLVRSVIVDKEDGSVYEIVYLPPLLQRPQSISVGDSWSAKSVAVVTVDTNGATRTERLELPEVEARVVGAVLLNGEQGEAIGLVVEERSDGILVRRIIYSDSAHGAVRFELPVSMVWGELATLSLRHPGFQDFLHINVFMGLELIHVAILTAVLLVFRLIFYIPNLYRR
ncbi:hypothetical protein CSUB_C1202 [Candidatus Caldarchaeum subterraneum]|uniref:Uncharacterized protein n=2 Tax=Thermoproteati TaxID=1783275 RepID=H5SGG7_9CREN|nr:hypothetical protein HGMM_F29F10C24 [Candidatus Caldarchaeum subterraneum]BAJ51053.1 hypothetical protein CSUB_C1202 [Candidatus Caldarchaeum subterraneum]BAL55253.1 hypothetical protein HGMM_F25A04C39 [uncultured crenarchaeote]